MQNNAKSQNKNVHTFIPMQRKKVRDKGRLRWKMKKGVYNRKKRKKRNAVRDFTWKQSRTGVTHYVILSFPQSPSSFQWELWHAELLVRKRINVAEFLQLVYKRGKNGKIVCTNNRKRKIAGRIVSLLFVLQLKNKKKVAAKYAAD